MHIPALGDVWYTAIMNSTDEVSDVRNLPERQSIHLFVMEDYWEFSANFAPLTNLNFSDAYIPNFSGMLCDTRFSSPSRE